MRETKYTQLVCATLSGDHVTRARIAGRPACKCLACGWVFPILDRPRLLCDDCAKPTEGEWVPTTEWGRQRKAERDRNRTGAHTPPDGE